MPGSGSRTVQTKYKNNGKDLGLIDNGVHICKGYQELIPTKQVKLLPD